MKYFQLMSLKPVNHVLLKTNQNEVFSMTRNVVKLSIVESVKTNEIKVFLMWNS